MVGNQDLSVLEVLILRSIQHTRNIENLAKVARVSPATLGREIARLQIGGYIGEDGTITARGVKALQERSRGVS
jgi:hypothetical protein